MTDEEVKHILIEHNEYEAAAWVRDFVNENVPFTPTEPGWYWFNVKSRNRCWIARFLTTVNIQDKTFKGVNELFKFEDVEFYPTRIEEPPE